MIKRSAKAKYPVECLVIFFKCFTYYLAMANCLCLGSKLYDMYSLISEQDQVENSLYLTAG